MPPQGGIHLGIGATQLIQDAGQPGAAQPQVGTPGGRVGAIDAGQRGERQVKVAKLVRAVAGGRLGHHGSAR